MKRMFLRTWLITGVLFWLGWGGMMSREWGLQIAMTAGFFAGVLFGASMAGFQVWMHRSRAAKQQMVMPVQEGEKILKEGAANHRLGGEFRGGWLRLTNRRLAFRPHAVNYRKDPMDLPLDAIAEVETILTWGIIPNGLRVKTVDGVAHQFVVFDRESWCGAIRSVAKGAHRT